MIIITMPKIAKQVASMSALTPIKVNDSGWRTLRCDWRRANDGLSI
ncbi:hypothetical protein SPWS13_3154 [Shewanella putrefaciens]|nr:hypothetical protein SPWS13_3154 [Shewanella putrefaciens]